MKIMSIAGARPNFMKIAPLVRALRGHSVEHVLVHTGQHYDDDMSKAFFEELQIPKPDANSRCGQRLICLPNRPDNDRVRKGARRQQTRLGRGRRRCVNATAACWVVARKHQARVAHIEAGLRSND